MPRFKHPAFLDGKEVEVELDDAKVITVEQANIRTKETVRSRLARQAVNLRGELLKDPDFVNEVLVSKGVDPKTLKPAEPTGKTLTDADVARLQEEWRLKELKPVQEQLAAATERFNRQAAATLEADLERAFVAVGVDKSLAPRFAKLEMSRFGFDEKSGKHALKHGDGFAFSTRATEEMPYKGVDEWVAEWAGDPVNAPFVRPPTQHGPNLGADPTAKGQAPANLQRSKMSVEEKTAFVAKHGYEAFTKLAP